MKKALIILFSSLALVSMTAHAKQDKHDDLPPGLKKNQARGKGLPPGWQKKLQKGQRLDKEVYDAGRVVVPLDNKGYISIKVDDKIIRLLKATHEIIDVTSSR